MTSRTVLALCSLVLGACAQWPGAIDTPAAPTVPTASSAGPSVAASAAPALPAPSSTSAAPAVSGPDTAGAAAPQTPGATPDPDDAAAADASATPAEAAARARKKDAEDAANAVQASGAPTDPLEPEKAVALGDAAAESDLWSRVRGTFGMPELDNDLVRDHEQWYGRRPDYVKRMTERGGRYLYHIIEEVQRRGMPGELALLPFIESAFNPQAMSTARASGMWQFMPATGRDFELKQNVFRDDRRDILASTRAALDYLGRLHDMFGDWHLALAAYNWGEGNVQKAIARNQRAGKPAGYEDLNMPMETRHYVPKLQAVKNIVLDPSRFGLELPELRNHPYFLSVPIRRDIDVDLAARLAGLSVDEFKTLNPQMNKPVILAAGTPQILLPYDNADRFVRNLGAHRGPLASWTAWVVPRTMRPGDAARDSGMSESMLREINFIPPRMLVKAGSTLLVPRGIGGGIDVSEHLADNAAMMLAPDVPPLRKVTVKARKGETVASLARRYRVSPAQVAQWNRIDSGAKLTTGHAVVIYQPAGKARSAVVRTVAAPPARASAPKSLARASAKASAAPRTAAASGKSKPAARGRSVASAGGRVARN